MVLLGLHAGATGLHAVALGPDDGAVATSYAALAPEVPRPGWSEVAPEAVWRAALQALDEVCTAAGAGPGAGSASGLGVSGGHDTLLVWDHETLGSPRPAMTGVDRRAAVVVDALGPQARAAVSARTGHELDASRLGPRLRWLAEHEPHTWALVEAGRYAVGTVASYLVARMTRGLWHVCDTSTAEATLLLDHERPEAWSPELLGVFGVPVDALPELVATSGPIATTDPRVCLGLALPVTALAVTALATESAGLHAGRRGAPTADGTGPDAEPGRTAALGAAYLAGRGAGEESPAAP